MVPYFKLLAMIPLGSICHIFAVLTMQNNLMADNRFVNVILDQQLEIKLKIKIDNSIVHTTFDHVENKVL